MTFRFRSEDDALWVELFKIALSSLSGGIPEHAVYWAERIANEALPKVKERMAQQDVVNTTHVPSRALFEPMLAKERAKREQDEADSGFAVSR